MPLWRIPQYRCRCTSGPPPSLSLHQPEFVRSSTEEKMQTFQYQQPTTVDQAVQAGAKSKTVQQFADVRFIAGGTTLVDLMKLDVERPNQVVDINTLPLG